MVKAPHNPLKYVEKAVPKQVWDIKAQASSFDFGFTSGYCWEISMSPSEIGQVVTTGGDGTSRHTRSPARLLPKITDTPSTGREVYFYILEIGPN